MFDIETKILSGRKIPSLYHPNTSVGQIIISSLEKAPNQIASINHDDGTTMTFEELRIMSIRVCLNLKSHGIKNGDTVGIIAENSTHVIPILIGCYLLQCQVWPVDPTFAWEKIDHVVNLVKLKLIFCDSRAILRVKETLKKYNCDAEMVSLFEKRDDCLHYEDFLMKKHQDENNYIPERTNDSAKKTPALLICTSGSTGIPKIVLFPHAGLTKDIYDWPVVFGDIFYSSSNLHWVTFHIFLVFTIVHGATRIISAKTPTPDLIAEILIKHKVNHSFLATTFAGNLIQYLLKNKVDATEFDHLKTVTIGGSPVPKSTRVALRSFLTKSEIFSLYGLSESSGVAVNGRKMQHIVDSRFLGDLVPNTLGKVVDQQHCALNPFEKGELVLKPEFPFLGYQGDPKKTKETIDDDGWLYTGDYGYYDNDGNFFMIGRVNDFITISGNRLFFDEVENVILEIQGVNECIVVGVPDKIDLGNEIPIALIISNIQDKNILKKEIFKILENKFDLKYKIAEIYFVEKLIKSIAGKIIRNQNGKIATQLYYQEDLK